MEQEWAAVITIEETDPGPQAWNLNGSSAAFDCSSTRKTMKLSLICKSKSELKWLGFTVSKLCLLSGLLLFIMNYIFLKDR